VWLSTDKLFSTFISIFSTNRGQEGKTFPRRTRHSLNTDERMQTSRANTENGTVENSVASNLEILCCYLLGGVISRRPRHPCRKAQLGYLTMQLSLSLRCLEWFSRSTLPAEKTTCIQAPNSSPRLLDPGHLVCSHHTLRLVHHGVGIRPFPIMTRVSILPASTDEKKNTHASLSGGWSRDLAVTFGE